MVETKKTSKSSSKTTKTKTRKKTKKSNSDSSSNISELTSSDPNENINKEACEKYGITLSEIPIEPVEPYSRYNQDDTVYGFVSEVTHDQDGTEVEVKDWGYCLEENRIGLGFQNMLRSQIMEEVIKTYGLVPLVDFTGMPDDVISWDNSTSKSSGEGGDLSGDSTGSASIDEAVAKAIQGISDPLQKAKAIDKAFKNYIFYEKYWDCQYPNDLDAAWKDQNLNCADGANVLCAMFIKGGLNSVILHTTDHYIVKVTINGQSYYTDNAANTGQHTTRPFGQVWGDDPSSGSEVGTRISA